MQIIKEKTLPRNNKNFADEMSEIQLVLGKELAQINENLHNQCEYFNKEISKIIRFNCTGNGKKLRSLICLLSGACFNKLESNHIKLATIIETIHIATLVHDDIIDGGKIRRGKPSSNHKFGSEIAVLIGDILFAHALNQATEFNDLYLCRRLAHATKQVCSGEIIQTLFKFDKKISKAKYLEIIKMKTAELFAQAAELSAYLSNASHEQQKIISKFAKKFGVAFQIYDDCLDIQGNESALGKTLNTDIKTGKYTLPVIILFSNNSKIDLKNAIIQAQEFALKMLNDAQKELDKLNLQNQYLLSLKKIVHYLEKKLKK